MQNSMEKEINDISKEDGIVDEKNQKHFEQEFAQIQGEIKKLNNFTPRIEKLEKDLELLDVKGNGKDEELE